MSNLFKKIAVAALLVVTVLTFGGSFAPAQAQTISELQAQLAALQAQLAALQGTSSAYVWTRSLTIGSTGEDVRRLQIFLNTHGSLVAPSSDGAGRPGFETSYFGVKTRAAVANFQLRNGIAPAVGYFGPITRARVNAIVAAEASVVVPVPTPTPTPTPVPVSGAFTVSVASDNPMAGTIVSDTVLVMQSAAPVLKLTFSNGTSVTQQVNTLRLTRGGFSIDADINNLFLYEGSTRLADMSGSSNKVFTFNSSSGLFTVPANSSKTVWVGVNVAAGVTNGKTLSFTVASSADVVLASGTIGGAFPLMGNTFTVASVTDLGYIDITAFATSNPSTIDPSDTSAELWRFTATANSQKMTLKRIVLTMVGTISPSDIQDLVLRVGGVNISPVAQIGTDNKVVFDFTTPYEIASGQNRVIALNGKVLKGTGRTFKFTIRSTADFVSHDTNYGVDTTPLVSGAAFTVVEPTSSTTINTGTLTISRSTNSPSGNVAAGAIDSPLARFDYKAAGEDIKIVNVRVSVDSTIAGVGTDTLNDGKLYFNGSQVGTTDDSVADVTTEVFSLGNTVIIPAGTTGVFEYRANIEQADGTDLAAGDTIVVSLVAGTSGDAVTQSSLTNLTPSASTGNTLTAQVGTLTRAKNTSMADGSTVTPTGVVGATNVKVASVVLTAGSGEAVNLTQVVLGDDGDNTTSDFGDNFQNLVLKNNGIAIAPTQGTLSGTAGADYTFTLSPSVTIAAGAQYVIDAYADILTGAAGYTGTGTVGLEFVSATATGVSTSSAASISTVLDLHNIVIAAQGTLTITQNAATPVAGQIVMGETDVTMAILDFAAGSSEDMKVSAITITDTSSFAGSLANIKLYDGATQIGSTVASFSAQSNGTATFNLASDWVIPKNTTKVLTIKATVNAFGSAVSGGAHTLNLASNANVTTTGASSAASITETVTSATGTAQDVYRSRVTVAKGASSPSGTATAGAAATVLEFTAAADTRYDAVVNTVALTIAGSVDTTSSGNATLYKSTDLVTALATETYRAPTCSAGTTTLTVSDTTGIPVGANVMVSINGTVVTREVVSITNGTTMVIDSAVTACDGTTDFVYYRPVQPGTGKLYFGAQSALGDDLASGATSITVASTDGFAFGDTVSYDGFTSAGVAVTRASGCVISAITSATAITVSACVSTPASTIDYDYLSTDANAITNNHNSLATAYTGRVAQTVAAGSTMTFVVKGDTTGATANETLRLDIASVGDFNWDDLVNFGIITDTKVIPVTGGTLSY